MKFRNKRSININSATTIVIAFAFGCVASIADAYYLSDGNHQQNKRTNKVYIGLFTADCTVNGISGVYVTGFRSNSPAKNAGLQIGDMIIRYRTMKVFRSSGLTWLIDATPLQTLADIKVLNRHHKMVMISVAPLIIKRTDAKLSDNYSPGCEVLDKYSNSR